jgi:hypothetical protein
MFSDRMLKAGRFVLVSFALAGTYLLLQQFWLGAAELGAGWQAQLGASSGARDAERVAARSREAETRLPAEWRAGAFRLGWQVGYVAELLGSQALSDAALRQQGEARLAPLVAQAVTLAESMGVGPARWPSVSTADEFARLQSRFEDDESGLGQRIENTLSLRHRHLYLAGVHAGINQAVVNTSGGSLFNGSSAALFVRHATLAGVPPESWLALARAPDGDTPAIRRARFQAALATFDAALAASPSGAGR